MQTGSAFFPAYHNRSCGLHMQLWFGMPQRYPAAAIVLSGSTHSIIKCVCVFVLNCQVAQIHLKTMNSPQHELYLFGICFVIWTAPCVYHIVVWLCCSYSVSLSQASWHYVEILSTLAVMEFDSIKCVKCYKTKTVNSRFGVSPLESKI